MQLNSNRPEVTQTKECDGRQPARGRFLSASKFTRLGRRRRRPGLAAYGKLHDSDLAAVAVDFFQVPPAENLCHRKIGHEDDRFHDAKCDGDDEPNEFAPQLRNAVGNNTRAMTKCAAIERRSVRRMNGGHARGFAAAVPRAIEGVLPLASSD